MSVFQKRFLMSESCTFRDNAAVKNASPRRPKGRSILDWSFFLFFFFFAFFRARRCRGA